MQSLKSQDYPYEIKKYAFINYNANKITIYDTNAYAVFFNKINRVAFKGKGKVNIVHIGDSHIQADYFSGAFRTKIQSFFIGSVSGRGFIFPYKIANTNNPLNYKVSSKGKWSSCSNIQKDINCPLGLSGISVTTKNPDASITVAIKDPKIKGYDFDKLMVFHNFSNKSFKPVIKNARIKQTTEYPGKGYTLFEFEDNITSITLGFEKTDSSQTNFTLYGLNFDSSDAGIIYHTIGVNGAKVESYLRCKFFTENLSALNPDLVIISLGTNDSYTNVFDSVRFKKQLISLISLIKKASVNTAILFTTPGDNLMKRTYPNQNVKLASYIIKEISKQYNASYWDFYTVMGGFGSIDYWRYEELAYKDYLHYTRKGYEYQAHLFFNAFLKAYDGFTENIKQE